MLFVMRDYSKPYYDPRELTAAFNGVCKKLGKEEFCSTSEMPLLGKQVSLLAQSEGVNIAPTGDLGTVGINLHHLIEYIIERGIASREELRQFVDAELVTIPSHPLINYFED